MGADRKAEPQAVFGPLILVLMSAVGVVLGYSLSIVQARRLGALAFQDYAVVVAAMGLLCAIAEAGVGKFALKVIPEFATSGRWPLAAGYWRFSVCLVLIASALITGCVLISEGVEDGEFGDYPLAVAVLFLPAAAICGIGIDFVMANRAAVRGTLISQLLLPATTLLVVLVAQFKVSNYTIVTALLCYGTGSVLGAVYCVVAFLWTSPRQQLMTDPDYQHRDWLPQCLYFASISFLASWTLRISLLVLELLPIPEVEVAVFAAAMETGCLILMLSKSTDKMFQPQMSAILAKQDWESGRRMRRNRYLLLGSGCILFMCTVLIFGGDLLGLYGQAFIAGYPTLPCALLRSARA